MKKKVRFPCRTPFFWLEGLLFISTFLSLDHGSFAATWPGNLAGLGAGDAGNTAPDGPNSNPDLL